MLRRLYFVLLVIVLWTGAAASVRAAEDEAKAGLAAAKEQLGKLVPLAVQDGKLGVDWKALDELNDPKKAKQGDENAPAEANPPAQGGIQIRGGRIQIQGGIGVIGGGGLQIIGGMGGDMGQGLAGVFNEVIAKGGGGGNQSQSMSMSNSSMEISAENGNLSGKLTHDPVQRHYGLRLQEKGAAETVISVEDEPKSGFTLRLTGPGEERSILLAQEPKGRVSLVARNGAEKVTLEDESFEKLVRAEPEKVQVCLLRPLHDLGIAPPIHPFSPSVMFMAACGYAPPPAEVAKQADALIAKLSDDAMEVREKATTDLIALYPRVMQTVQQAQKNPKDEEAKMRLAKVIEAHPMLAKAKAYVESKKLHEDKPYLLEVMKTVPNLKSAARARLAQLYGKDYGDDPAAWPKTEKI